MTLRYTTFLTMLLALTIFALPAAAELSDKKIDKLISKLPAEDQQQIVALQIFMKPDEVEAYLLLPDHDARSSFLDETGYLRKWKNIREEMLPQVIARNVVNGMTKDELWMTWGKPVQVRQSFYQKAYVDIYTYFFYENRKGTPVPTSDRDDPNSYNRPQWEMNIYFHNDHVVSILEEGALFNPQDLNDTAQPVINLEPDEDEEEAVEEGEEGETEGETEGGEEKSE